MFWLRGRCSIGRQIDNDLALPGNALSRQHALVSGGPAGYAITDLQSRNGTYVNRRLISRPTLLRDGDEILIGDVTMRFRSTQRPDTPDSAAPGEPKATQVLNQVHAADTWLLILDIAGYSALNERLGSEQALRRLQAWIAGLRPLLEHNGGTIHRYLGDAVFAYWPADPAATAHVLATLRALAAFRLLSPLPFRLVLHHGPVLFTKSEQGEELSGQDVNFLFRAEKIAKQFGTDAMLSETAVRALGFEGRCAALGNAPVDGMTGVFAFFLPPPDLTASAPA
jgi:pSer/pThr/pTyr-binding forkhead associated (FHA) protein